MARTAQAGPHAKITAALAALEEARAYLKTAPHDFGGHRGEALDSVTVAIRQLRVCLKY